MRVARGRVRTLDRHVGEDFDGGDDARAEGNAFALELVGISLAVEALVVMAHVLHQARRARHGADDAPADIGVRLHEGVFLEPERAPPAEDLVRSNHPAYIL